MKRIIQDRYAPASQDQECSRCQRRIRRKKRLLVRVWLGNGEVNIEGLCRKCANSEAHEIASDPCLSEEDPRTGILIIWALEKLNHGRREERAFAAYILGEWHP